VPSIVLVCLILGPLESFARKDTPHVSALEHAHVNEVGDLPIPGDAPPADGDGSLDMLLRELALELEEEIDDFTNDVVHSTFGRMLCGTLGLSFVVFVGMSVRDLRSFIQLYSLSQDKITAFQKSEPDAGDEEAVWSVGAMVALTSYRFYTGFLSATWLPYLLAMEGQYLWAENQSLFMGVAKLIYGATVLLNPIFGLVGDQAVRLSHGVGRRLFVCTGVCVASSGIVVCICSGRSHHYYPFIFGILLWRLGEALNDVTTEALVPEMVPKSQYGIASAIKASMFLVGGLFGYALLIVFATVHYSWLYYAYLSGMFLGAIPSLMLLTKDAPSGGRLPASHSFVSSLWQAYVIPTCYKGGFPRACLAVFVFSLGTAPMFFLLLILRDLVGLSDPRGLQQQFSATSIVFFLSAAGASMFSALSGDKPPPRDTVLSFEEQERRREQRITKLVFSMAVFGVVCMGIPMLCLFDSIATRLLAFYILAVFFGASFGSAFSRFQDCTWAELPDDADMANAMGFNVMSRLLGVGLGNFIAGIVLDCYYIGEEVAPSTLTTKLPRSSKLISLVGGHHRTLLLQTTGDPMEAKQVYKEMGYIVMCTYCGLLVLLAAYLCWSALRSRLDEVKSILSPSDQRAADGQGTA